MLKILIVGLGSIAKKHILALWKIRPNAKIYALRSCKDAPKVDGIIDIYQYNDASDVDFAIISNPTHLHRSAIENLLACRVPLFIEKPPVHKLSDALYLLNKMENDEIFSYVACNLRFHPIIQFVKRYLKGNATKRINEVNIYCGSYLPDWRPGIDFRSVYSANREMGGGVHLDLYHELDYTYWFFGKPDKVDSVMRSVSSLEIDAVDYANYNLCYANFTCNITLNYYRPAAKRQIEIVFDDEIIVADIVKNIVCDKNGNILFEAKNYTVLNTYTEQIQYFLKKLSENQKPMNTFEESIDVLNICLSNEQ